ncbi:hypothetical protein D915_005177 [Fasciola hepatica]|nr:hypothetical protein D915_005177 [Fasciola hepatica]
MSMDCISVCSLTTDHNFVLADSDSADEINSATNEIKSHLKITLLENEMMLRFIDNVEEGEVQGNLQLA